MNKTEYKCTLLINNVYLCTNFKISNMDRYDIFKERMLDDYKNGTVNDSVYKPYFEWKLGKYNIRNLHLKEVRRMIEAASIDIEKYNHKYPHAFENQSPYIGNDPWDNFKGFGSDSYIVSYLYAIEEEMTNLLVMRFFG